MATKGFIPLHAKPAAKVTECCSAIPTSKNLLGNLFSKGVKPVPEDIAAVIATTSGLFSAISQIVFPKTSLQLFFPLAGKVPLSASKGSTPWKRTVSFSAGR